MNSSDRGARARLDGWLDLADRGWHLFPVRPGSKVPAITQWEQRATTEPDRLARFFTAHPDHNAGIACGPSGLLVVDCDLPKPDQRASRADGRERLKTLAIEHGGLPATWEVFTPSCGTHLYFRAPADQALGNSSRLLGPLLDTRGRGGQVVAPGSVLPAGGYSLIDDRDPVDLPAWIAERLSAPPELDRSEPSKPVADRSAYVEAALQAELARVRDAERGGHNTAVFTASRALGQLAAGGLLDPAEARRELLAATDRLVDGPCDCTAAEIAATVRSGLAYGARRPRELPTRHATDRESGTATCDLTSTIPQADSDRVEVARSAVAAVDGQLMAVNPVHEAVDEAGDAAGWAR